MTNTNKMNFEVFALDEKEKDEGCGVYFRCWPRCRSFIWRLSEL